MVRLKTAVLLGFSLELGAILAGASDADGKSLREFGINVGIGFQLKDDLLDAYADKKKFGKQVGGDIIANKKTFLLIKSIEMGSNSQKQELNRWAALKKFSKSEKIQAVKAIYDSLSIPALAEKKINSYFKKGFSQLENLNCSERAKSRLVQFTELLIARES